MIVMALPMARMIFMDSHIVGIIVMDSNNVMITVMN